MVLVKDFDSILDLLKRFPDEESYIKHLEFIRWNENTPNSGASAPFQLKTHEEFN
jgi:hypothetical protein